MKIIISFIFPIFISCTIPNFYKTNSGCVENKKFKKEFFYHIQYIEKNISIKQDSMFKSSLIFISNYTQVSFQKMMNYSRTYPIGIYKEDKKVWLEWYEENKCKNLQLKKNYPIHEQYKEILEY